MKFQTSVIRFSKVIPLMMILFMAIPFQTSAQRRPTKKKVVHTSPSRHYEKLPKRGAKIKTVPTKARLISHRKTQYRFHDGVFYKPYQNQFVVVASPIGIRISTLPVGYRPITIRNRRYFYYYGTYYVASGREYEVVSPPVGALVESIPDGYQELEVRGDTYYIVDDTQYKAIIHEGEIWYEVIKVG